MNRLMPHAFKLTQRRKRRSSIRRILKDRDKMIRKLRAKGKV